MKKRPVKGRGGGAEWAGQKQGDQLRGSCNDPEEGRWWFNDHLGEYGVLCLTHVVEQTLMLQPSEKYTV